MRGGRGHARGRSRCESSRWRPVTQDLDVGARSKVFDALGELFPAVAGELEVQAREVAVGCGSRGGVRDRVEVNVDG